MIGLSERSFEAYLRESGILNATAIQQMESLTRVRSESVAALLRRTGMVAEEQLSHAMLRYTGWESVGLETLQPLEPVVRQSMIETGLSHAFCVQNGLIVWLTEGELNCATADFPGRSAGGVLQGKALQLGRAVRMWLARHGDVERLLAQLDTTGGRTAVHTGGNIAHLRELAEEGPIIELVNGLLSQAVTRRASDIHIEPGEAQFLVRVRVDGVMRELQRVPFDRFDATVCRIKILSQLDIAERRLPQDGRMTARIHGESFDVRVSVLPGVRGESVVLRLLRQDRQSYSLAGLGMLSDHAAMFEAWVKTPNGIVLVTGPTGSGKTTTLYTALDLGNDGLNKIVTVEDPVEYKLQGITQLQVNPDIGYTFASALRSILRHDPDVILIGEIRDQETASIAVQSALTGHLVFSTLHTNSGAGAVTRLVDMGIEPFLLASSLRGLMAQRLVRRLCPHCSQAVEHPSAQQTALLEGAVERARGVAPDMVSAKPQIRVPVGCDICLHTGYLGRIAVYELFDVDDALRHRILANTSETELIAELRQRGVRSMTDDGLLKAWVGITTVDEVLTV